MTQREPTTKDSLILDRHGYIHLRRDHFWVVVNDEDPADPYRPVMVGDWWKETGWRVLHVAPEAGGGA